MARRDYGIYNLHYGEFIESFSTEHEARNYIKNTGLKDVRLVKFTSEDVDVLDFVEIARF